MKISILLPYKENFTPEYAGAVSLFVNDTAQYSKYKKNITVFGKTNYKKRLKLNYINLKNKSFFEISKTKSYVNEFIKIESINKSDLIEIHNRPQYAFFISKKCSTKIVFYFHNDPLDMQGSKTIKERLKLVDICDKIVFNSEWSRKQFLKYLKKININKLFVIKQSTKKTNINISSKKKFITFVGKLNKAKGYDIYAQAIIKILNKYPKWMAFAIGDEKRESYNFYHKNFKILGFLENKDVMKHYSRSSIAVACPRWNEPFGRSSLEASANGCAVIITNKGGLPETITNGIILKRLSIKTLYEQLVKLISNKKILLKYQKLSLKNFYLTNKYASKKIDLYRDELLYIKKNKSKTLNIDHNIKILHITNFNLRFDGRLFYNTGRRINNGLIKLNHNVLEISDRDITHDNKNIGDIDGSKTLNKKIINIVQNFKPNLIILGHADKVKTETILKIKDLDKSLKFAQWFLDPINKFGPDYSKNKERFMKLYHLMDSNFITTSPDMLTFLKNDKKCFYMPNPCDEALDSLNIYNNIRPTNDIFFAMSHGAHRGVLKGGKKDERYKLLNFVSNDFNIKTDFYGINRIQPIWADKFLRSLSNSKMGLNLSRGKPIKYYSSDRMAQYMGNGLATLIDEKTKYRDFFNDDEMIFYKNSNDLIEKINKYKKDNKLRVKIAKKGTQKYRRSFNSKLVANYIVNKTMNFKDIKKNLWEK